MTAIDTSELNNMLKYFSKLEERLGNSKPYMQYLAENELDRTQSRFLNGEDPNGNPWPDLSPATIDRKLSSTPLIDTGALYDSLEYVISNDSWVVGTSTDYTEYHQNGTEHLPARPFVGVDEKSVEKDVEWIFSTMFENR